MTTIDFKFIAYLFYMAGVTSHFIIVFKYGDGVWTYAPSAPAIVVIDVAYTTVGMR